METRVNVWCVHLNADGASGFAGALEAFAEPVFQAAVSTSGDVL